MPLELIALDFVWRNEGGTRHKLHFDETDYSVVVKNRASLPKPWRWEVYRAGRSRQNKAIAGLFLRPWQPR